MRSDIGVRKPAYCTAEGLAMLAFQPAALVDDIVTRGLRARTVKTNTDPRRLREMLAEVRERGYAIEDEESEAGMRCVAAPVRNGASDVVAAVGIAGPVQRLPDDVLVSFAPHVVRTAEAISVRLGYRARAAF
jgi:IclR family KDG regulon transcriptional repressor